MNTGRTRKLHIERSCPSKESNCRPYCYEATVLTTNHCATVVPMMYSAVLMSLWSFLVQLVNCVVMQYLMILSMVHL